MPHHADNTSVIVSTEEHSLRGPTINFAKIPYKCHLSDMLKYYRCTGLFMNMSESACTCYISNTHTLIIIEN
jgi:hypothetical protein